MGSQLLSAFGDKMIINPFRYAGGAFVPTDIASLEFWLDAANRGSTFETWDDVSGNANHFSKVDGSFPLFSGGICTFNAVSNHRVQGPSFAALTEGEIFWRVKVNNDPPAGANQSGISSLGTDVAARNHYPLNGSGVVYHGFGSDTRKTCGDPATDLATWHTLNIHSASNDWALKIDGSVLFSTATNTVAFTATPKIGISDNTYDFDGQVKAICMFNAKLSPGDRASMESYMASL